MSRIFKFMPHYTFSSFPVGPRIVHKQYSLGSKPTLRSQPLTVEEQDENTSNTQCRQSSKQTHTTTNPQTLEHGSRKQDRRSRQSGPRCIVASKQASRICRIDHRQVHKHTLEEDKDANDVDDDTNTTDDPVDMAVSCPCKDEQSNRDEETREQSWDESTFGGTHAVGKDLGLHDVVEVGVVGCYGDDDADGDGQEYKTHLADVEAIAVDVDQREDFEEGVEDCVTEGDVDVRVGLGGQESVFV